MAVDNLPSSMLAAQVVEFNQPYKIHEIPAPSHKDIGSTEILVKIAVASYCHTDSMVTAGKFGSKLPITGSHEGAGTVIAVGSSVTRFKPGDRVMCGLMKDGCGECRTCKGPEDYRHYCPNSGPGLGILRDGAFAQYAVCDAAQTNKIPDEVSFETAAPMACAGRTIYRGVVQSKVPKGNWLGLVGSGGGLGHLGIQFAKALGMKVIGVDARDEGLELSKNAGADLVVDARMKKKEVVKKVQDATNGAGCYATVNISDGKTAADLACAITMTHGRMIQIAQPDEISISFPEIIFRDIRVEGSLLCSTKQSQEMLDLIAEKNISVKTNLFHGLEKLPELIELVHSGHLQGKGIIIVDEEAIKSEREATSKLV